MNWIDSNGLGPRFRMGIGLSSGPVMSGNVGSEQRLEYTAVGDTTNTASRLETMTKDTPYQSYVAEQTRTRLTDQTSDLRFVGELQLRGRESRVRVWSLETQPPPPLPTQ